MNLPQNINISGELLMGNIISQEARKRQAIVEYALKKVNNSTKNALAQWKKQNVAIEMTKDIFMIGKNLAILMN